MTAPLPPSSSVTRGVCATFWSRHPTSALPVKDTILTRSSRTIRSASSVRHGMTVTAGGGAPASIRISPIDSADSGVFDAGRTMHGHPAASAGPSLWPTSRSGALNGVIASTVPTGKRLVSPIRPSPRGTASIGTSSPVDALRRASSPAICRISAVRWTSKRVSQTALPVSSVIWRASSSSRARTRPAAAIRISARRNGGTAAISGSAAAADASARSTIASSASDTRAASLPS